MYSQYYLDPQSHYKYRNRKNAYQSQGGQVSTSTVSTTPTTSGSKSIVRPLTIDVVALTKEVSKSVSEELLRLAEQLARVAPEKKSANYAPATDV